jgi:hypothetical protein
MITPRVLSDSGLGVFDDSRADGLLEKKETGPAQPFCGDSERSKEGRTNDAVARETTECIHAVRCSVGMLREH